MNPNGHPGSEGSARRPRGRWRDLVGRLLRPMGEALMAHGGVDMYLTAADGERARLRSLDSGFRLMLRTDTGGPPPGHPERLRPDVPLTRQELLLLQDLLHEVPGRGR
ncbi:hypothetical protein OEB94_04080 [Streptomyces sp. ICN988]|uniref:DUF6059 family protein n=1 Tax=unclassified Streptomyces TaxID=2593676 RepID=UPI0013C846AF|nr:DUF6059 family protein [Streptomyces sp. ICN988]MCV2458456.1 hypothetical protein [Streptomyces sp. ICN988]NDZ72108.1 hypothetical protein [Streptomyces sp. SID10362]